LRSVEALQSAIGVHVFINPGRRKDKDLLRPNQKLSESKSFLGSYFFSGVDEGIYSFPCVASVKEKAYADFIIPLNERVSGHSAVVKLYAVYWPGDPAVAELRVGSAEIGSPPRSE